MRVDIFCACAQKLRLLTNNLNLFFDLLIFKALHNKLELVVLNVYVCVKLKTCANRSVLPPVCDAHLWGFCWQPLKFDSTSMRPLQTCARGGAVHDKLLQFQACCAARLICWSCFGPFVFFFSFPSDLNLQEGLGPLVPWQRRSDHRAASLLVALGLLSAAQPVVDQLRSLYPDHSTTATPLFGDMINKKLQQHSYRLLGAFCSTAFVCAAVWGET